MQPRSFPVIYVDETCLKEVKHNPRLLLYNGSLNELKNLNNLINEKQVIYIDLNNKLFYDSPKDNLRKFVEIVYERAIEFVFNLETKKVSCAIATLKPEHKEALYVDSDADVEIIEVKGGRVFPLIDVGSGVRKGDKLCYAVSRKFEVRVIRSTVRGVVFYVGETYFGEIPALYIVIIGEENVVKLARGT
ncbi:MAG: DUF2118 domain-containing protein [Ignisphaera sp.]|uniref:DUF2118 domain-containing protein n=1 Tax=Ignisphaera aggregans TaxID=334771 RepID=A0A7C4JJ08_9CREN